MPADLSAYRLIFISVPGFLDPNNYFTAGETANLNAFLADGAHRIVLIGEWDGSTARGSRCSRQLAADLGGVLLVLPGRSSTSSASPTIARPRTPPIPGRWIDRPVQGGDLGVGPWNGGFLSGREPGHAVGGQQRDRYPVHSAGSGTSNTLSDGCGHLGDANTLEIRQAPLSRHVRRRAFADDPVDVGCREGELPVAGSPRDDWKFAPAGPCRWGPFHCSTAPPHRDQRGPWGPPGLWPACRLKPPDRVAPSRCRRGCRSSSSSAGPDHAHGAATRPSLGLVLGARRKLDRAPERRRRS